MGKKRKKQLAARVDIKVNQAELFVRMMEAMSRKPRQDDRSVEEQFEEFAKHDPTSILIYTAGARAVLEYAAECMRSAGLEFQIRDDLTKLLEYRKS